MGFLLPHELLGWEGSRALFVLILQQGNWGTKRWDELPGVTRLFRTVHCEVTSVRRMPAACTRWVQPEEPCAALGQAAHEKQRSYRYRQIENKQKQNVLEKASSWKTRLVIRGRKRGEHEYRTESNSPWQPQTASLRCEVLHFGAICEVNLFPILPSTSVLALHLWFMQTHRKNHFSLAIRLVLGSVSPIFPCPFVFRVHLFSTVFMKDLMSNSRG